MYDDDEKTTYPIAADLGWCGTKDALMQEAASGYRKDGEPNKRNKYAAHCYICGRYIPAGAGGLTWNKRESRWLAYCIVGMGREGRR